MLLPLYLGKVLNLNLCQKDYFGVKDIVVVAMGVLKGLIVGIGISNSLEVTSSGGNGSGCLTTGVLVSVGNLMGVL